MVQHVATLSPIPITAEHGFTLMEVIVATTLLSVLAVYALPKSLAPASLTLSVQARNAADHIRRARSQAMVCKQRMVVSVPSNTVLSVASGGSPACLAQSDFSFTHGVQVSGSTLRFNSLGQPVDNAGVPVASPIRYTLTSTNGNTATSTVMVEALTGRVSVSN